MTQTPGADAPQNTTEEDAIVADLMGKRKRGERGATTLPPLEEKTVTTADLARGWEYPDPEGEAARLEKFMGVKGPFTPTEAKELDRRMRSSAVEDRFPGYTDGPSVVVFPSGGPHGPDCECGDLTPEELAAVEELMAGLAPALAEALGMGRTPAEVRTGVSDPEAAILDTLGRLQPLVDAVIKDGAAIGTATALMDKDPLRAMATVAEESKKLRKDYRAIRDAVVLVSQLLPAVKGERAKDAEGLPIWFLPATEGSGWLTTAQEGSPGEGWKALYVR